MTRHVDNAFTRSTSQGGAVDTRTMPAMHGRIAKIEVSGSPDYFEPSEFWTLELSPIRAVDALSAWRRISEPRLSQNLLFDVQLAEVVQARFATSPLINHLRHYQILPLEVYGNACVVLDDVALTRFLKLAGSLHARIVRVVGPIESRDAMAMVRAAESGGSPLIAEVRATAALELRPDEASRLESVNRDAALDLVGENFRQYLAALLDRAPESIEMPARHQVEHLLDITGQVHVRPIETERFSTSVDIGVATDDEVDHGPAKLSLIYDLPSDTWHDEA